MSVSEKQPQPTSNANNVVHINVGDFWMETCSGRKIDFVNPDPEQVFLEDIAWGLSRIPRFCGHTGDWQPLSVAMHSVWVGMYVWEETNNAEASLHALLHDAHEAYTGDIPKPLKSLPGLRNEIQAVEERLQLAIYRALNIPALTPEIAKLVEQADQQALAIEARHHMRSGAASWPLPENDITARLMGAAEPKKPVQAFEQFMATYRVFACKVKGVL